MRGSFTRHLLAASFGFVITLAVVLFEASANAAWPPALADIARQLEAVTYDIRLRTFAGREQIGEQPVVIVDLDEESLAEIGQWPWPRTRIATLLERLADAGAAVVAFDVVFSEPEQNAVDRVLAATADELSAAAVATLRAAAPRLDGDRILAERIRGLSPTDVALGVFLGQGTHGVGGRPEAIQRLSPDVHTSLLSFSSWTGPDAQLLGRARNGHVITAPDDLDGVIRRAPLVVRLGEDVVPALALQIVRQYLLLDEVDLVTVRQGERLVPQALRLGSSVRVPLDSRGRVLVPYRGGAGTFPYLPAADVLANRLDASTRARLQDAIVLIGTSSIGLADLRSTPTAQVYHGVEVHATLVDALLEAAQRARDPGARPAFPTEPDLSDEIAIVGLLGAGILLSILMPMLGATAISILFVVLTGGWLFLNGYAWAGWGLDLPTVSPLLLTLGLTFSYLLRGFLSEANNRRGLKEMFDQYVPPAHIDRMITTGRRNTLEGESRVMTVLFADIQGFTALSEGLPAPEVKRVLNEFFTPITRGILEHQGTIDKYVGDMIMAFWNAPWSTRTTGNTPSPPPTRWCGSWIASRSSSRRAACRRSRSASA